MLGVAPIVNLPNYLLRDGGRTLLARQRRSASRAASDHRVPGRYRAQAAQPRPQRVPRLPQAQRQGPCLFFFFFFIYAPRYATLALLLVADVSKPSIITLTTSSFSSSGVAVVVRREAPHHPAADHGARPLAPTRAHQRQPRGAHDRALHVRHDPREGAHTDQPRFCVSCVSCAMCACRVRVLCVVSCVVLTSSFFISGRA